MGRPCSICNHPDRAAIEEQLLESMWGYKRIGTYYKVGYRSLLRHYKNCMTEIRVKDRLWKDNVPAGFESDEKGTTAPPSGRRDETAIPEHMIEVDTGAGTIAIEKGSDEAEFHTANIKELMAGTFTEKPLSEEDKALAALQKEDNKMLSGFEPDPGVVWPDPIKKRFRRHSD